MNELNFNFLAEKTSQRYIYANGLPMSEFNIDISETLAFPRSVLPIQSLNRAAPWVLLVASLTVMIGLAMGGRGWEFLFAFTIGTITALGWMRFTAPAKMVIGGPDKDAVTLVVLNMFETPSLFGFRFTKLRNTDTWLPSGPDIYTWDPAIRLTRSKDEICLTGPGCILKLIPAALERSGYGGQKLTHDLTQR